MLQKNFRLFNESIQIEIIPGFDDGGTDVVADIVVAVGFDAPTTNGANERDVATVDRAFTAAAAAPFERGHTFGGGGGTVNIDRAKKTQNNPVIKRS